MQKGVVYAFYARQIYAVFFHRFFLLALKQLLVCAVCCVQTSYFNDSLFSAPISPLLRDAGFEPGYGFDGRRSGQAFDPVHRLEQGAHPCHTFRPCGVCGQCAGAAYSELSAGRPCRGGYSPAPHRDLAGVDGRLEAAAPLALLPFCVSVRCGFGHCADAHFGVSRRVAVLCRPSQPVRLARVNRLAVYERSVLCVAATFCSHHTD